MTTSCRGIDFAAPLAQRANARLMLVHRARQSLTDAHVATANAINTGDCLVINETRVVPATDRPPRHDRRCLGRLFLGQEVPGRSAITGQNARQAGHRRANHPH